MTYITRTVEDAAIGVGVIDRPESFDVLRRPGVAAVVWRRQLQPDFQDWIDSVDPGNLPSSRIILRAEAVREAVEVVCDQAGLAATDHRQMLIDDITMLAGQFAELMDSRFIRLRLDVVRDDACRKFHIDAVTARLVCTYRGSGTQYGISTDGAEPRRIFSAPTGAPMLLRGTLWPESPQSGLLHRSPPIEGTAMTRLVLAIDPITGEPGGA